MALTMLGAQLVNSPDENSKNARTISAVYDLLRQGELRKAPSWNFAIKTAELAKDPTPPQFDMSYRYKLPADFLSLAPLYANANYNDRDWVMEGDYIISNWAPVNIRYNSDVEEEGLMDPLFAQALAAKIALTVCDSITQSNTKKQIAATEYKDAIDAARKANSFDIIAQTTPDDTYWTVRQ